tara:strand:- start:77701 stop:78246 length:546 start_codon:yes stop_codon:yes gene_type:complete
LSVRFSLGHFTSPSSLCIALAVVACGCGESDSQGSDAAPESRFDAGPADAAAGVVCQNAQASYAGTLNSPAAEDDSQALVFVAQLDETDDALRIEVASAAATTGTLQLPDPAWTVQICLDDLSGACSDELLAYSGTMTVGSVEDRFRASLDEVIFVDDLDAPSCSAALSQASFDVAILGPI